MFQLKDFVSVTASMLNHLRAVTTKITDFQPGSVARTLVEAPAVEIEELYHQMFIGLREAIPAATFKSFGFTKLPAVTARGYVTVTAPTPATSELIVPVGTEFTTTDGTAVYASFSAVSWPVGASSISVPVMAAVTGLAGNISAGMITTSTAFPSPYTISNTAIYNGLDEETDAEREAKFAAFIQSLSRGTIAALEYCIRLSDVRDGLGGIVEYVSRIGILEEAGRVRIYIYGSMGAPSDELLAAAQTLIDGKRDVEAGIVIVGYRAAGIRVDVLPMVQRSVPLSIKVKMLPGYDLTSGVIQQLQDVFSTEISRVEAGDTLYLGTLIEALLSVGGVREIVPVTTENFTCGVYEVLTPGAFTAVEL